MSSTTLSATVRLSIVKPIDGKWDDLGAVLRALRAPLHRVLNGVVRELELGARPGPWWECTEKGSAKGQAYCSPATASYRIARDLWLAERQAAADRVTEGKRVYTGDAVIAVVTPASPIVRGVGSAALECWQKFSKERWKGTMSLPSFRNRSPIYIDGDGVRLRSEDGNIILELKLSKWFSVAVAVDGTSDHATLRRLLAGEYKPGNVKVVEDSDRCSGKTKWGVRLAYSFPAPSQRIGVTMAVHRGVSTMLTMAVARSSETARDARTEVLETGEDILRHKAGYRARRRSLGRQGRQLGTGAKGHGVDRRHERITRLEDAEARWVDTKCKEIAAHLFRKAERLGVGRFLLEDWTNPATTGAPELGEHLEYLVRSFPLAQLRSTIEWGARKRGYTVEVVSTDHNSRDCPSCSHRHEKAQVGTFRCDACLLERPVDVVFAWNMLRRDGKAPGIKEAQNAGKRARGRLKTTPAEAVLKD